MDAHLLFDGAAGNRVARADAAIRRRQKFRNDEKRNPLGAFGRAFDARQHQMDDIRRKIVLAGRDENFCAGDFVAAVRLRRRARSHETEIGAALRLGQIHRAGPFAADELGQVERLLLRRRVGEQGRDRALGEPGIHREGHVGRTQKLADGLRYHRRQALAAEFGRRRKPDPAAIGELLMGGLKSRRRRDAAVVMAAAAFLVADAIKRRQHVLAEFRRFAEYGLDEIGRGLGETGQVVVAIDMEHVAQQEHDVVNRSLVARHDVALPRARRKRIKPIG